MQRSILDDFNHYLFEWPWTNLLTFVFCAYLAFIIAFSLLLQLLVRLTKTAGVCYVRQFYAGAMHTCSTAAC